MLSYLKDDYAFTIPLSIALQSPDEMIDQMINNKGNKDFKSLFKICELDLDKLFNQQIVKFELLTQIFMQMKDQITQNLQELKEIQEQLRKLKESFFEKCHCNLLNQLIDQLKELDKQTKSDQYKQIIEKLNNSMIEEMLKDNYSLITNNTNEILQCHQDISDIPDNLSHDCLNFMQSQNLHQNTQFIYRFQPKCYNNIDLFIISEEKEFVYIELVQGLFLKKNFLLFLLIVTIMRLLCIQLQYLDHVFKTTHSS